jgi:tRNA uridine 5-carboxymethylaminomethyl modification enzyme
VEQKRLAISEEVSRLDRTYVGYDSLTQILRRPETSYGDLPDGQRSLPSEVTQQVEIIVKYAGYISRQETELARFHDLEDRAIPKDFDYTGITSLRHEARQKLQTIRPVTIGQATRISGVTPADISLVLVWLKRGTAKTVSNSSADGCCDEL